MNKRDTKQQKSLLIPILIILSALLLGTLIGIFVVIPAMKPNPPKTSWIEPTQGELWLQGQALYQQHCASCHGSNLEGQTNWRQRKADGKLPAPPHDESGHTWHHPDAELIAITRDGMVPGVTAPEGYQSDMPGFGKILSDAEIELILGYIKSFWSDRALQAQKEVTLQLIQR